VKYENSVLESFEYFCQMSSKWIPLILSYSVSKLVHFLANNTNGRTYATVLHPSSSSSSVFVCDVMYYG